MLQLDLSLGASWDVLLIIMSVSTILGSILALTFSYTHRKRVYEKSFITTLIILPLVISIIILLIQDNLARAFSLAGVFALVRFRTAMADSKDITYILTTVGIALASSLGYIDFAIIITLFVSFVFILLDYLKLDKDKSSHSKLQIVIPENLDYTTAFKSLFDKYLVTYQLSKVKTTDFGSLFELTYLIQLKKEFNQKEFLDELRILNNNLNITLVNEYAALMIND